MTARRRVVITGAGVVSAAGRGVDAFWSACVEGRSALRPPRRFEAARFGPIEAGEVPGPLPAGEEPSCWFARTAADEALRAAGIEAGRLPPAAGVVVGSCLGASLRTVREAPSSGSVAYGGFASPAHRLAEIHRLAGPVLAISSACTSGLAAIAAAASCVRRGEADLMLAGGADALSEFVVSGFSILHVLTTTRVRPFDRRRDGLALGEGAGLLVVEARDAALERGAPILAEILGDGSAGDAHHMLGPAPDGGGLHHAMAAALDDARREAGAVDFVAAHGTGTLPSDGMEMTALRAVLGEHAARVPVNSIKAVVGHALGAAGAFGVVMAVRTMAEGIIPPTTNLEEPEEGCALDLVAGTARRRPVRCALTITSGFAGHNVALALGAP